MSFDTSGATSQVNNAANVGSGAISSFDPTATGQSNLTSLSNMLGTNGESQSAQMKNFQDQYSAAVKANPSVTDLYNTANQMYNVPALQTNATQLQNAVNQVTPNSYQAAKGFDYSNAQVQNQIAKQLQFLQPEANAATANANTASGLASNYVQAGQLQNAQNLLPIQNSAQLFAQQQAAQQTGWNQNAANVLAALTSKMQSGVTLSSAEMSSFVQLSAQQEAYNQAVMQANENLQATQMANQNYVLKPSEQLYNAYNGNVHTAPSA